MRWCAVTVTLLDRLLHYADVTVIEGEATESTRASRRRRRGGGGKK